ncbi:MAG: type I DNA topoisomerase [Ruminococcaceae bacterium]|nr:type I DNA topoisomerase [Oscillospiraceae bacterium]
MSKLVIVESPSKIKSIKKYLGSSYTVMASKGHIRDLPKSTLGVDIEHDFRPQYVNMSDKKELIKELKAAAAKSDFVYLATDPDREGEAISWHLAQILKLDMNNENRVCFNEITKTGIKAGMANPQKINLDLVDAQQARRVLDRIVGYKLSPFLWKKVKRGLSAGRVQSVALRLIVDREREIEAFIPEEYWSIEAVFAKDNGIFSAHFHGTADGKKLSIANEQEVNKILDDLVGADYTVSEVKKTKRKIQPAPPFITSTMQQEASRKLGYTGQRTMKVAQQLYEGVSVEGNPVGLITYMRTDSLRISEEARAAVNAFVKREYGDNYLPEKPRYFKSKASAQDAHEAIRPTDVELTPARVRDALTDEQFKLYSLIWSRFVSSLMAEGINDVVSIDITANKYMFKASETTLYFDGFTRLYQEGKDTVDEEKNDKLPPLKKGDAVENKSLEPKQHFTQPPARYNEPTLIKALEENGIGRPSTYAPIVSNILSKDYIERVQKAFKPTALGMVVTDLLKERFEKIVDVKFTAGMEESLDEIEHGNSKWQKILEDFYNDFENSLNQAESELEGQKLKVPEVESDEVCELCGRKMVIKSGRFGKFLACPGFPECKNAKPLPEDEVKEPCPKCGSKLVKKRSKKGKTFYACDSYPECDFAAPGIPTGEVCETCGSFMLKGTRGRTYCINSDCPTRVEGREKAAAKKKTTAKRSTAKKSTTKKSASKGKKDE